MNSSKVEPSHTSSQKHSLLEKNLLLNQFQDKLSQQEKMQKTLHSLQQITKTFQKNVDSNQKLSLKSKSIKSRKKSKEQNSNLLNENRILKKFLDSKIKRSLSQQSRSLSKANQLHKQTPLVKPPVYKVSESAKKDPLLSNYFQDKKRPEDQEQGSFWRNFETMERNSRQVTFLHNEIDISKLSFSELLKLQQKVHLRLQELHPQSLETFRNTNQDPPPTSSFRTNEHIPPPQEKSPH